MGQLRVVLEVPIWAHRYEKTKKRLRKNTTEKHYGKKYPKSEFGYFFP